MPCLLYALTQLITLLLLLLPGRDQVRRGYRFRENTVHHSANGYRDAEGTFTGPATQQIQSSLLSD